MTKKAKRGPVMVTLDLPPDIFDVEGATIKRRKRIPIGRVDEMRATKDSSAVYKHMAFFMPEWSGVVDCEGEPITKQPKDDPMVFAELDVMEQFPYLVNLVKSTFKPGGEINPTPPAPTS